MRRSRKEKKKEAEKELMDRGEGKGSVLLSSSLRFLPVNCLGNRSYWS
jgi:hypothetical protein